jgi:hypothetical protein
MPVRSAKQHRRSRPRTTRSSASKRSREPSEREPTPPLEVEPAARAPARSADDRSVEARMGDLRTAVRRLRAAVVDVKDAALSLVRGEVRAFSRRGRSLRLRRAR